MRCLAAPAALALMLLFSACGQVRQFKNLKQVEFTLDGVRDVRLAGAPLDRVRGFGDLSAADALRITSAVGGGSAPLEMPLLVGAENPAENRETARVLELNYEVFVDDKRAATGRVDEPVSLRPGERRVIPTTARLDRVRDVGATSATSSGWPSRSPAAATAPPASASKGGR